jgi:abequosyltransferase
MRLSICIPTYNRHDELLRLINSIEIAVKSLPSTADVEVVISDNASTDGTEAAMREAQSRLIYISYSRNEKNQGFAANLNKAIEISSGDYCWLMGSDDIILPDALMRVWQHLQRGVSVIVGNPITRSTERKFFLFDDQRDHQFGSTDDFVLYISQCREISAAFAFMSTLIVRRDFWNNAQCTRYELMHPYTHMLRIVRGLASNGGIVRCLNAPIVATGHAGNEWNTTVLPHFELDLSTIQYIEGKIFNSSPPVLLAYGAIFRRQYSTIELLKARVESTIDRWSSMVPFLTASGYSQFLLKKTLIDTVLFRIYLRIKELRKPQSKPTAGVLKNSNKYLR